MTPVRTRSLRVMSALNRAVLREDGHITVRGEETRLLQAAERADAEIRAAVAEALEEAAADLEGWPAADIYGLVGPFGRLLSWDEKAYATDVIRRAAARVRARKEGIP